MIITHFEFGLKRPWVICMTRQYWMFALTPRSKKDCGVWMTCCAELLLPGRIISVGK